MSINFLSETVGPNGNIQAPGIMNQLGRPNLDPLTVLVREAVQNSWDARANDNNTVEFDLSGWTLNKKQLDCLKRNLFGKRPRSQFLPLDLVLSENVDVLAVSDRGTLGLGGPTRADIYTGKGARDFVDFVRNVGQPSDKQNSGGTYGYGKAAFYRLSMAQTIVIYTRCFVNGKYQSRLIAAALGNPYNHENKIYTGRHWWGDLINGIIEPILDKKADDIAMQLGLQQLKDNNCGTTIVVIAPNFSGEKVTDQLSLFKDEKNRTPYQALCYMAESILWYFWPKMMPIGNKKPAMKFHISWQGNEIKLPKPENYPPLKGYVDSMLLLKQNKSGSAMNHQLMEIASQKPNQKIGYIAIHLFQISNSNFFDTHEDDKVKIEGFTHHTAIMRQPELVVKYIPGPILSSEWFGYGGVFIANEEVDSIFASSEPPTHDNWVVDSLEDRRSKIIVRAAMREVSNVMETFSKPSSVSNPDGVLVPLGSFANHLGESLFTSVIGTAATIEPPVKYVQPPNQKLQLNEKKPSPENPLFPTASLAGAVEPEGTIYYIPQESDSSVSDQNFPEQGIDGSKPDENGKQVANSKSKPVGKAKIQPVTEGDHLLIDGTEALLIRFIVQPGDNSEGTVVEVKTYAVVDGYQVESDPPIGGSSSTVLCWITPDGEKIKGSQRIKIPMDKHGEWQVVLSSPEDIMLGIDFVAEAMEKI